MRLRRLFSGSAEAASPGPTSQRQGVPLGVRGGESVVRVDDRGVLHSDSRWSLRWWIGTEDGWHDPATRVGVRQSFRSGTPVIETALRVPGGDARATTWAARTAHGSSAVLEVRNERPASFGLALIVGPAPELEVHGCLVTSGDMPILALERPPADVLAATAVEQLWDELASSGGSTMPMGAVDGYLALVYPIAHTTGLRVSVALDGLVTAPGDVPDADAVGRGWQRQLGEATRLVLPDAELEHLITAQRCYLLSDPAPVSPAVDAAVALQLARFDHVVEARRRLDTVLLDGTPTEVVEAAAAYVRLDPEVAPGLVEPAIVALGKIGRRRMVAEAGYLEAVASIFEAAGRDDEAKTLREGAPRLASRTSQPMTATTTLSWQEMRATASSVGTWPSTAGHDPLQAAGLLAAVVSALIDDTDPARLDLLPGWIELWRGQGVEIHGLAISAGQLSLALRWHGERPALLWEIEPNVAGVRRGVPTLLCSSLDPSWQGSGWRGEALLGLPRSEDPMPFDPGDSFS